MKLINKTILITGGATGIGFSLAKVLALQNNRVVIVGRSQDKLEQAQKEIPDLEFIQADISNPEQIDQLFDELERRNIIPDVLFNNAGVIEVWEILKTPLSAHAIFSKLNTNMAGPIAMTNHFIRQADKKSQNYIINITTEAAIMPIPILPLYSSSKAGLSVFTKALRVQLKGSSFIVAEIVPPAVETKMTTEDLNNTTKLVLPIDFARNVIRQIEAGKLYYAPSANAKMLHFLRRVSPKTGLKIIDKMSRKQLFGKSVNGKTPQTEIPFDIKAN
ncbi:MAG TPA: SDR family NAD(P)-dependent oxidoreductase [Chitinophagaceae bacterium]|nr:SDR family NAD(P)-dependent oxidoreductase [Chitinophagaceae bacterium]